MNLAFVKKFYRPFKDRLSVHSSSSSVNNEQKNDSTSSKGSISIDQKQRTYSHGAAFRIDLLLE